MSLLVAIVFLVVLALTWLAVALALKFWETQRKRRVEGMLQTVSGQPASPEPQLAVHVRKERPSVLQGLIARVGFLRTVEARIKQAGLDWTLERFLVTTLVLALVGALLGSRLKVFTGLSALAFAGLLGCLPYVYIHRRRKQRFGQFEKQFPEALDFLARAMRAGHAFSASLEMLSAESPPPLGPEFRRLYDEQNLGAPLHHALRNLAMRVPLVDVRFFVSAVMLQKETGGNLGEILRNLARVIRERFQLKGQVRAMSAHGRITAAVLTILPIVTVLGLMLLAPEFMQYLANDKDGRYLILAAVVGMISGYYFMRRITNIKI